MAAIIAQLTLNARRRKQRSKGYLTADKCNYILRPFDKCYVPEKHNPHLRNEKLYEKNKQGRETAKGIDSILRVVLQITKYILRYFFHDKKCLA